MKRLCNFSSFHSRFDVTTGCPAAAADPFRGFTLKKETRKKSSVPGGSYRIICSPVDRLFVSSTTLSHFVFASPLHLVIPHFFFAFAINVLFDISFYVIKLSYYRARIRFNIIPSVHSFICLTSFNTAFYPRSRFFPCLSFLSLLLTLLPPHILSSSVSFFFLIFYFIQTRLSLSSTALRGVSQGYKSLYTRLRDSASHRIASHAKLFCARRTA